MLARSCKTKGMRFQKEVKQKLLAKNPELQIQSTTAGVPGTDLKVLNFNFPFSIECKHTKKLNFKLAMEQAEKNANKDNKLPLLVHRVDRGETFATLKLDHFLNLLKNAAGQDNLKRFFGNDNSQASKTS